MSFFLPLRGLKSRSPDQRLRLRFVAIFEDLGHAATAGAAIAPLHRLVRALRPGRRRQAEVARQRLQALTRLLGTEPAYAEGLSRALLLLFAEQQFLQLFTDAGILPEQGLFTGLWQRLTLRLLPEERHADQMRDTLRAIFDDDRDYLWIEAIPDTDWAALLEALRGAREQVGQRRRMATQLLEALQVLSYRIAAQGLARELVRNDPDIERYESPFMAQSLELHVFLEEHRRALIEARTPTLDDRPLLVLLGQCESIVQRVWKRAAERGTSVSLTALTVRLSQNIERLRLLLGLIEPQALATLNLRRVQLFKHLVRAENRRNGLREHWSQHMELLAARVTHHTGKTGERYVANSRSEYWSMLRSAMGAGFIVAFMAFNKAQLGLTPHSPFVQALLYSLNYGLGFVLIYVLHFTIATKQPAMTASHIAHSLDSYSPDRDRLDGLVELCVRTVRSQFIAVMGNVSVALATALLFGTALSLLGEGPPLPPATAAKLVADASPWDSPAIFHAAIAGVFLFLAGLVAGYYDNKAVYARVPQRLRQLGWLRRLLGAARSERLAQYIGANLGGLCGNFALGCMLGSAGTIGMILGLPIDIRHVTFATANVAYGLLGLHFQVSRADLLEVALGVLAIGTANLVVSFTLALYVALRARRVRFDETGRLLRKLLRRFLARPSEFFWPPPAAAAPEEAPLRH